ncbi:uncharacterized protein LOC112258575 isoform X1 [Oncorhynchus tshawytscha]|uniref:C2H2-type domain-containing protein n=2 Tax=Oncorhynchus tshawytscha TaxID=74940 RepID=A0AAZ3NPS2_ONCTS|nr:uncharacterized protein LOC112258575 isoform X1 [Oncorhynchus tshawytscha]
MNGAVYISFFQGQLESALEEVVQVAVQEITKTVGSSLTSMLMKTAVKEQENQRLKLELQSLKFECNGVENGAEFNGGREDNAATDRTKPETHTPSHSAERGVYANTLRLDQKCRVVGQLKMVMEHVLEFAVCELTKIVEASFDDLLLELTRKEREHIALEEQLRHLTHQENRKGGVSRRSGSENNTAFPSGSEDTRQESRNVTVKIVREQREQTETTNDSDKQAVLTVAQDWVPILDKVFGQKWCSDLWQIKELASGKGGEERTGGSGLGIVGSFPSLNALIRENLEPAPTSPLQDPQWMPLEDMEVLSSTLDTPQDPPATISAKVEESLRSPSMLHRLLTLPAQLLDEDENAMDTIPLLADASPGRAAERRQNTESPNQSCPSPPKKKVAVSLEEEEEKEDKGTTTLDSKVKTVPVKGRKAHECKECGKKFSRAPLLKAHQQNHITTAMAMTPAICCSKCGKRFSKASRLQAHLRTHTVKKS